MNLPFQANQTILFQGDSITHRGRDRENPNDMGTGYASSCAAWLGALYPELGLRFFNRGIGGNRVVDLAARWQEDCLALEPDWVSVMIGINDTGRRFGTQKTLTSAAQFEKVYREILLRVRDHCGAKFILCEPFLIPSVPERKKWRSDLDPKIQVTRNLAIEFGAICVPFDAVFASACTKREPLSWAEDGVHPNSAGHMLMAKAWLEAVGVAVPR